MSSGEATEQVEMIAHSNKSAFYVCGAIYWQQICAAGQREA